MQISLEDTLPIDVLTSVVKKQNWHAHTRTHAELYKQH